MQTERIVCLFRNGGDQVLRVPREFELDGREAVLRKESDRLIVEPVRRPSVLALLASWEPLDEDFPAVDWPESTDGAQNRLPLVKAPLTGSRTKKVAP